MKKTFLVLAIGLVMLTGVHAKSTNAVEPNGIVESVFGPNEFCKAVIKGDLAAVKKMISEGENVNKKSCGMTPAHFAARYNQPEVLELLIANGANLNKRCDQGYTVGKYAEMANATEALNVIKDAMNS